MVIQKVRWSRKTKCLTKRAISPVIAELTVVALAIALAIAFIGITQGWFSFSSSQSEGIYIYPDSKLYIDYGNNIVYADLYLYAQYKPYIKIINVILDKNSAVSYEVVTIEQGGPITFDENGHPILPAGTKAILRVYFDVNPNNVTPDYGDRVELLIVTDIGYAYKAAVKLVATN